MTDNAKVTLVTTGAMVKVRLTPNPTGGAIQSNVVTITGINQFLNEIATGQSVSTNNLVGNIDMGTF